MDQNENTDRLVSLSNGAEVPFADAVRQFGMLVSFLEDTAQEWDMVYLLRRACLGQAIDADHARALTGERLLRPDGTVEPVLREIVLSSVRGQGRLLHLDSPFTETLDRVMAEYIQSREYVRCSLPLREAEAFLASDPVERSVRRVLKATAPESNWTDRRDDNDGPTR